MHIKLATLIVVIITAGCQAKKFAVCELQKGIEEGAKITGKINIEQESSGAPTVFKINIKGIDLKASNSVDKGFHVHANGDLTNKCSDAGGHFNPKNVKHGKPSDSVQNRHVGDLGNVQVRNDGSVSQTITDNLANLIGSDNIIGKAIVLHQNKDDLTSQPTGNAGGRLACCLIKLDESGAGNYNKPSIVISLFAAIVSLLILSF